MRQTHQAQPQIGGGIANVKINFKSRDDIPKILGGLQWIYSQKKLRDQIFEKLEKVLPTNNVGRPGMDSWKVLVLAVLRTGLNCDYDRLHNLANEHKTLRLIMGHGGIFEDEYEYNFQTIKDNVSLLIDEVLNDINEDVVKAGHDLLPKKKVENLNARVDSFVVETNVHYPTDINLLWDAMRKVIELTARTCKKSGLTDYRQSEYNKRCIKKEFRKAQIANKSRKEDEKKKAHENYLNVAKTQLFRAKITCDKLKMKGICVKEIERFMGHAWRQIDQTERRVIKGERIPHDEKVFSLFQEHTNWCVKGKAGVPVELGVSVCIAEDQFGFILGHKIMFNGCDKDVAVPMVRSVLSRYSNLESASFDKGFHSPENQKELAELLKKVILPKKGKLSKERQAVENAEDFIAARHQHSAVESAINCLEKHGLDICLDHGVDGFKRYVSCAILGKNLHQLGALLEKKRHKKEKRKPYGSAKLAA